MADERRRKDWERRAAGERTAGDDVLRVAALWLAVEFHRGEVTVREVLEIARAFLTFLEGKDAG